MLVKPLYSAFELVRMPMRDYLKPTIAGWCALALSACGGGTISPHVPIQQHFPAGTSKVSMTTADFTMGGPCAVSMDGFAWYTLPSGAIPPIDFTEASCSAPATIESNGPPPIPMWAKPTGTTQALFVATSLQETYSLQGMQAIEHEAEAAAIPVTWMIGNPQYLTQNAAYYNALHTSNGDDVELEDNASLYALAHSALPWYAPAVSVEGAGHERNIAGALALGNNAFWGITWNSHGTDNTSDEGAPWGTYCADPTSYKRPSPSGSCSLVSFEWTSRDLTRAYLTDTLAQGYSAEAAFSTDPDDILLRANFGSAAGAQYERNLVDAYAAAGQGMPLVMMSQQESSDEAMRGAQDGGVLLALYEQAKSDGMQAMTLRGADAAVHTFLARSRAIAFPYLPGGVATIYNDVAYTPATIDYHDNASGMTFLSGHTLPARLFEYAQDPTSVFNRPLVATYPGDADYPSLVSVTVSGEQLIFQFKAAVATHFGVAIWSDPSPLGVSGANVTSAGRAGFVASFDLPAGPSIESISCPGCRSTHFPLSG